MAQQRSFHIYQVDINSSDLTFDPTVMAITSSYTVFAECSIYTEFTVLFARSAKSGVGYFVSPYGITVTHMDCSA